MLYFKLAFLAQPAAASMLIAPLLAAPNPPQEVRLAHATIFCPASFEDDPPPLTVSYFFPEVHPLEPTADSMGAMPQALKFGDTTPRLPQPLRRSISSAVDYADLDFLSDSGGNDDAAIAAAAQAQGIELPDTSAMAPRLRLDRAQAVMHEQSAALFGELTAYDAIERRLWDEFDDCGRIDDTDALRQRDAAAFRCLRCLDKECNGAGYAGRELPSPLTEARAKFSSLCDLIVTGGAAATCRSLQEAEEAISRAEDELIDRHAAHKKASLRNRRLGAESSPSMAEVTVARNSLVVANLELIAALRTVAVNIQLGLVEIIGTDGLGRALRVVGRGHGDPLLERLQKHARWAATQAACDAELAKLDPAGIHATTQQFVAQSPSAQSEAALMRPDGLSGYTEVREIYPFRIHSARRHGSFVALKTYPESREAAYSRELAVLKALRSPDGHVVPVQGAFRAGGYLYLELSWCTGGTLQNWCLQHPGLIGADDVDAFVRSLRIFRHVWQALAWVHQHGIAHGDLALPNVLLTADHRPMLADFERCRRVTGSGPGDGAWRGLPLGTRDYAAPELEESGDGESPMPTLPADVYAGGTMMAKAFLGLQLSVSGCPYHPTRGQRCLPDERTDVDLADFLQRALAQSPLARPTASSAAGHRALDPAQFLRRRGVFSNGGGRRRSPPDALLSKAERLFQEYRSRPSAEPLMFSRDAVFDAMVQSRVGDWSEDELLGEWRIILNDESGVDGGGLRREVISLFFEQFEHSSLVLRSGGDGPRQHALLFVADRQQADKSPQQWRQVWTAIGAMILRAVVHFGNAPVALSSAVFDCAFCRIGKLPPDDPQGSTPETAVSDLMQLREVRGDDWARSEVLDLLRRVRRADAQKEAGYRWMLSQQVPTTADIPGAPAAHAIPADALDTMDAMLEQLSYQFLVRNGHMVDGSLVHVGAVLEWALLWDIYLKYLGGGDRWLAYEALAEGLTARGHRTDLWAPLTGAQIVDTLEGASLTSDVVVANLEFKPNYGYDVQVQSFKNVIESFSTEELSMFLRFATGIGRLPANRRFPTGQKLTIRFMPDHLDRLPSAHTCFWTVEVPPYEDEADMATKLRQAVAAPQPFALS